MAETGFAWNDTVLFFSLLYSCFDLFSQWELFSECRRPIHRWLVVSFACIVCFRLMHVAGSRCARSGLEEATGEFLLNLRPKGVLAKVLLALNWLVVLPFFAAWTLLGTFWLRDISSYTPTCAPVDTYLWFAVFWVALSYAWLFVQAMLCGLACLLEYRVWSAQRHLEAIEDDDVRARWGSVGRLASFASLAEAGAAASRSPLRGLSIAEISALDGLLTCATAQVADDGVAGVDACGGVRACSPLLVPQVGTECSICLSELRPGDNLRRLPSCGHTFHRACVDVWLLRCADCPLCKRSARCCTSRSGALPDCGSTASCPAV